MKTITPILLTVVLIAGISVTTLCSAQTVAIGHISAEVIESVSASSNALTSLAIATPSVSTASTVDLGTMTINSGSNTTVNVVLKSATVSNTQGSAFTLDPGLSNNATAAVSSTNGSQNIQLTGTANLNSNQSSGLYEGSYTVVFAYN
jgi:hypothetical protein